MIASSLRSTSDSLSTMGLWMFGVKSSSHARLSLSAHSANEVIFPYGTQLGQSDYSKSQVTVQDCFGSNEDSKRTRDGMNGLSHYITTV